MVNLRVGRAVTQDVTNQQHMAAVLGLCLALRCSACSERRDEWRLSLHTAWTVFHSIHQLAAALCNTVVELRAMTLQ